MAAISSEPATAFCSHCRKDIPKLNIELHQAHCSRNLERCAICGDTVPKKHADEHYYNNHAPVDCSSCGETLGREVLAIHNAEQCPRRIITCHYCGFPLPAIDLLKHQEICGNRTEYCHTCNQYVRLHERAEHEVHFHHNSNGVSEFSRARNTSQREGGNHQRRGTHDGASRRWIMLSIAVTGVAMVIGSLFLRKKMENHEPEQ